MKRIFTVVLTVMLIQLPAFCADKSADLDKAGVKITYFGLFCFSVEDASGKITLTDPYDPETAGLELPYVRPNTVLLSHKQIKKDVRDVIVTPYEIIRSYGYQRIMGILYNGFMAGIGNIIYRWEMSGIKLLFLGNLKDAGLNEQLVKRVGSPDVLFFPVSGGSAEDNNEAWELIGDLKPRIVIPMYYAVSGLDETIKLKELDVFLEGRSEKTVFLDDRQLSIDGGKLPDEMVIFVLPYKEAEEAVPVEDDTEIKPE